MIEALEALLLSAEQRQRAISESGIELILNEQTPRVENTDFDFDIIQRVRTFARYCKHSLVGLAANQVAYNNKRIDSRFCIVRLDGSCMVALNPVIIEKIGATMRLKEQCLTWPNRILIAVRHEAVRVRYENLERQPVEKLVAGIEAIVWQHEIDHLNGVAEQILEQLTSGKEPRPNDPCPCGSGIKYKKCCR